MNFDWTKPMIVDWTGRSGQVIKEEDIKNSVIKRILRNKYCAPFCEREYTRVTPTWSPQDPWGTNCGNNRNRSSRFVPGLHPVPPYPQLSTITKVQHQQALRVLSAKYHYVQPRDCQLPNKKNYKVFQEIQELYDIEQKEYQKWAKQQWINGDCIRALRPKPILEKVYDADFKIRAAEVQSLPKNYNLAAQIPLEMKNQDFEFELMEDLINVDIQELPMVDYPEEMESDFSVLRPYPVPEPCTKHPCRFVLPGENSVSVLPLTEINHEIAQYAIENGVSFAASENALQCLLDMERNWKIPISVVEATSPDGDLRNVVVLGSEFDVVKECAIQRTYKAYKHLLQHTFAPSTGQYTIKSPTKQTVNPPKSNPVPQPFDPKLELGSSIDNDLAVSSDEDDKLEIVDSEQKGASGLIDPNVNMCDGEPGNEYSIHDEPEIERHNDDCEPNSESDQLIINDNEPNLEVSYSNATERDITKSSDEPESEREDDGCKPSSEPDQLMIDENQSNPEARNNKKDDVVHQSFVESKNEHKNYYCEPNSEMDQLNMIEDNESNQKISEHNNTSQINFYQSYKPDYSNDKTIPIDEPSSEQDQLKIDDASKTNLEPCYYEPDRNNTRESSFSIDNIETNRLWTTESSCSNSNELSYDINKVSSYNYAISKPSYSVNKETSNNTTQPSYSNDTSDSGDSGPETSTPKIKINNKNNIDVADLLETNKDTTLSLSETNENATPAVTRTNNGTPANLNEYNKNSTSLSLSETSLTESSLNANAPIKVCSNEPSTTELKIYEMGSRTSNVNKTNGIQPRTVPEEQPYIGPLTRKQKISKIVDVNKEPKTSEVNTIKSCIKQISYPNSKNITRYSDPIGQFNNFKCEMNSQTQGIGINPYQLTANLSSKQRARKLSENIYEKHGYCSRSDPKANGSKSRKLSINEIEHDYCEFPANFTGSDTSNDDSDSSDNVANEPNTPTKKPGVRRLSFSDKAPKFQNHSPNEHIVTCNPENLVTNKVVISAVKPRAEKVSLRELFGDESDSDEPICNYSNKNIDFCNNTEKNRESSESENVTSTENKSSVIQNSDKVATVSRTKQNTRKLSFSDAIAIEKSPLKPCLRKSSFSDTSPEKRNRTLSFSDPLTGDPEYNVSVSDSDSEESFIGFDDDGIAVTTSNLIHKNKKQNSNLTCMYGLRSKHKHISSPVQTNNKLKTTRQTNEQNCFIKIIPTKNKENVGPRRSLRLNARLNSGSSDNSNYSECLRTINSTNTSSLTTNKQVQIQSPGLRRSRRLSSRVCTEDNSDANKTKHSKTKLNLKDISIENANSLRRSPRLSVNKHTNTKNLKANTKTIESDNLTSFSKGTKKDKKRRKSLPANIFSNKENLYQILPLSNSLKNLNDIANMRTGLRSQERLNFINSLYNIDKSAFIEISKRTKRYLHRSLGSLCSEPDLSEGKVTERRKRYIRRSSSTCSETDQSYSELTMRPKKYTRRSNITPVTKTKNLQAADCSNVESIDRRDKISDRSKRYMRRSINPAYSSCEESDQPISNRRKKTRRQAEKTDTEIDHKANNEISPLIHLKSEVMDSTENQIDLLNLLETGQSTTDGSAHKNSTETYSVKIDLIEEISKNDADIKMCDENNEIMNESNIFNSRTTKMDVSDENTLHNTTAPFNTLDTRVALNRKADDVVEETDRTISSKLNQIKPAQDITKKNRIELTASNEASDDSDYFECNETQDINIFHFTIRNEADSDNESEIEDSPANGSQAKENLSTVVTGEIRKVADQTNNCSGNKSEQDQSISTERVETNKIESTLNTHTLNKDNAINNLMSTKNSQVSIDISEDLSHKPLDVNGLNKDTIEDIIGVNKCACKGTLFEKPPPRSFKKLRVKNTTTNMSLNMLVHSSHKVRKGSKEVILEPIVEYQPELGGVKQSAGRIRSLALSLMLRQQAGLINVRIDHENGNVIVVDNLSSNEFIERYGDQRSNVADMIHTAVDQLRYLMPGQYVLTHESCHGANAMLYSSRGSSFSAQTLSLRECTSMPDAEDALYAKIPPELGPVLLPYHKHRSTLPLAFTPYPGQVREDKRALARARHPPNAIKWPKKKKKSKKNRQVQPHVEQ